MSPHFVAVEQALQHTALLWLCAADGYDQAALCGALRARPEVCVWPHTPNSEGTLLVPDLDQLPAADQQVLLAWLLQQTPRPGLCVINSGPCAALEGPLRAAGWQPQRWGNHRLQWDADTLADWWQQQQLPAAEATGWLPRLGTWPRAWQLWAQARDCDDNTARLLQRWGMALLSPMLDSLPLPLQQALALQADQPHLHEPALLRLAGLGLGQWRPIRQRLLEAGWLLEGDTQDAWQPWIAHLLRLWREQPGLDWEGLVQLLAERPLTEIRAQLPLTPLPQLELPLFRRIGLSCIEQNHGHWLAARLAALPRLWWQQHPALDLLQAWLEVEVLRHSERAEPLLQRLLALPLTDDLYGSARLLQVIVSFHFDQISAVSEQLPQLPVLPKPLWAGFRLVEAGQLMLTGALPQARNQLEWVIGWADCQYQFHTKLAACYRLAQLYFFQGDWELCRKSAQLALQVAATQGMTEDPLLDSTYRLLAEIALQQGALDEASHWLAHDPHRQTNQDPYHQLPWQALRCIQQVWQGALQDLPEQLARLEQQRYSQQFCRLWQFRTGYTLALGYQQCGRPEALQRLLQRTPWHATPAHLYDLLDNLLHAWLALLTGQPLAVDALHQQQQLAHDWHVVWVVDQCELLRCLCQPVDLPAWQSLLAGLATRNAQLPLLLAGPRAVAPLQEISRWPQTSPAVLAFARQALTHLTRPLPDASLPDDSEGLSQRQWQILRLIAQGLSNDQMAQQLFVAPSTIKTHINHLYARLGVRTRAEAQAVARQRLTGGR